MTDWQNQLYYGDNLQILRDYIQDECIDLIYLDPPFNSNRSYNVLFKDESGLNSQSQITAFDDTWHWNSSAEQTYYELITDAPQRVITMIGALREFIGTNQIMAYLVMMTARLIELHRVLKSTGSLYLHCDTIAVHYLKIILDVIFGAKNFINQISWKRTSAHSDVIQGAQHFGRIQDILLLYAKEDKNRTWNPIWMPYENEYIEKIYRYTDEYGRRYQTQPLHAAKPGGDTLYEWKGKLPPKGRYWAFSKKNMEQLERDGRIVYSRNGVPRYKIYLDESKGVLAQDMWTDITPVHQLPKERLGYSTQKPIALLERIIQASSNENDIVMDPFCGCGTAIHATHKLNRRWIGIDITHLSISLIKYRLKDAFNLTEKQDYQVIGEPTSVGSAKQLALDNRYQFQWWALSLVHAKPVKEQKKKGKDQGIDGIINFIDSPDQKPKRIIVQVKSGKTGAKDIRDLKGTVERENAPIGIFITLEPPTKDMTKEAVSSGFYQSAHWGKTYPKIQILTIEQLLNNQKPDIPPLITTFKKAKKETIKDKSVQEKLL